MYKIGKNTVNTVIQQCQPNWTTSPPVHSSNLQLSPLFSLQSTVATFQQK